MIRSRTARHRVLRAGAVLLAVVALLAAPTTVASAAGSSTCAPPAPGPPPGEGVDLTATVLGPPASCDASSPGTGAGGAPSAGSPGGGTSSTASFSGSSTGSMNPDETVTVGSGLADADPATDEINLGGVLNVGGLSSAYIPSVNPFAGEVQLWFTVRNVSESTIDATADFWMESVFGNRIASVEGVSIAGLKPGEMRTLSAEVPGAGQWTVLMAHARFTPPDSVDGAELQPVVRDVTAFTFPWFFLLLLAAAIAAWVIVQALRRREPRATPVGVPA